MIPKSYSSFFNATLHWCHFCINHERSEIYTVPAVIYLHELQYMSQIITSGYAPSPEHPLGQSELPYNLRNRLRNMCVRADWLWPMAYLRIAWMDPQRRVANATVSTKAWMIIDYALLVIYWIPGRIRTDITKRQRVIILLFVNTLTFELPRRLSNQSSNNLQVCCTCRRTFNIFIIVSSWASSSFANLTLTYKYSFMTNFSFRFDSSGVFMKKENLNLPLNKII